MPDANTSAKAQQIIVIGALARSVAAAAEVVVPPDFYGQPQAFMPVVSLHATAHVSATARDGAARIIALCDQLDRLTEPQRSA